MVLVLRLLEDDRRRVVAAHYVRPTARDEHGHVQRLGPGRPRDVGRRTATASSTSAGASPRSSPCASAARPATSSSRSIAAAPYLTDLAATGVVDVDDVRAAIADYRTHSPTLAT